MELVEAVDEVAGRKDVFPHLPLTSASACSLLLEVAGEERPDLFGGDFELMNFSAVGQREVLAESQIEPESLQIEQMVLLLVVVLFARGCLAYRVLHCLQTDAVPSEPLVEQQTTLGRCERQPVTHCFSSPHLQE